MQKDKKRGIFWEIVEGRIPQAPASELFGFEMIEVGPDVGRIRIKFAAKPEFINVVGDIHGGLIAAMLDDTLGQSLATTLGPGEGVATVGINVNFIQRASPGSLIGEGHIIWKGKSMAFLSGELTSEHGELIATATGIARIVRLVIQDIKATPYNKD